MPVDQWTLYLDESGQMSEPDHDSIVAGLLVEGPVPGHLERRLRASMEDGTAGLSWPPHAHTLRSGKRLLDSVNEGKAGFTLVQQRQSRTWGESTWDAVASQYRQAVLRAIRGLPKTFSSRAWVVGALCDLPGACRPARYGQLVSDAYLEALVAVLVRVAILVRPAAGEHSLVSAHVASRHVHHTALPMPVHLGVALVMQVVNAAVRSLPSDFGVRFTVASQERFNARARPGIVAADWVANGLFSNQDRALRGSLEGLSALCEGTWSLPLMLDGRPTLAAAGPAHEAVLSAVRGESVECPADVHHPWVREQATSWKGVR